MQRFLFTLGACLVLALPAHAAAPDAQADPNTDIVVDVRKDGPTVIVDVEAPVVASIPVAWSVLTDYGRMAQYVTNLKSSAIIARRGDNELEVAQTGQAKHGPLSFSFKTVRAVYLTPYREIRSSLIEGDFKSYAFTTRIVDKGTHGVVIVHHGEYVPNAWVPPVIGPALIAAETRKQYAELRTEMLKRQATAP